MVYREQGASDAENTTNAEAIANNTETTDNDNVEEGTTDTVEVTAVNAATSNTEEAQADAFTVEATANIEEAQANIEEATANIEEATADAFTVEATSNTVELVVNTNTTSANASHVDATANHAFKDNTTNVHTVDKAEVAREVRPARTPTSVPIVSPIDVFQGFDDIRPYPDVPDAYVSDTYIASNTGIINSVSPDASTK